jgi:hypothetical protein
MIYRLTGLGLAMATLLVQPVFGGPRDNPLMELCARVDRTVAEWQPAADEKRFDQIGWCTSLLQAEKLAREHRRPIFLFTHDGRISLGRC